MFDKKNAPTTRALKSKSDVEAITKLKAIKPKKLDLPVGKGAVKHPSNDQRRKSGSS
jgi:hypothetical protein